MENFIVNALVYWAIGCVSLAICFITCYIIEENIRTSGFTLNGTVMIPKLHKLVILSLIPFVTIIISLVNIFQIVYLIKLKQTSYELYENALVTLCNFVEDKIDFFTCVNEFSKISSKYKSLKS